MYMEKKQPTHYIKAEHNQAIKLAGKLVAHLDTKDAARMKLNPVTHPYMKNELWMLLNVVKDMIDGNVEYHLVNEYEFVGGDLGISVWRSGNNRLQL